jgi:CrcB protein
MAHVLIVGIGGFIGSIARYLLSGVAQRCVTGSFPLGTLIVNVLGCLAIGFVWYLVDFRAWSNPQVRVFVTAGMLGGFTTFSAFGLETFALMRVGQNVLAAANVAGNVALGLAAVAIGWSAAKATFEWFS